MDKQNILFLFGLLLSFKVACCIQPPSNASPYDMIDDAKTQLETLRALVSGNIISAQDTFDVFFGDFMSYSFDVLDNGNMSIDAVHSRVSQELQQVKDLAQEAHVDVSHCMDGREQRINQMPDEEKNHLLVCVAEQVDIGVLLLDGENYIVDVVMTKVDHLDYQVMVCKESVQCITPVLNQIDRDIIELPREILEEVDKTKTLIDEMQDGMKECYDDHLADLTGGITELFEQITNCVNDVMGSR